MIDQDRTDTALGHHYVVEFLECDPERIATVEAVRPVLEEALRTSGATVLQRAYHQFEPTGMSAAILIEESHVCLHSWPEHGYMSADFFTCGPTMVAERAIEVMSRGFRSTDVRQIVLHRGATP